MQLTIAPALRCQSNVDGVTQRCLLLLPILYWFAQVLLLQTALASDDINKYSFEREVNGQEIKVIFEVGPFDEKAHEIKYVSPDVGYEIDGQRPIGNQGTRRAYTEFKRFDISWNGKQVSLERRAWSSIFDVPVKPIDPLSDASVGFAIIPAIDGSSLLFYFRPHSGDSGSPEQAWLIVNKDGTWKKFHNWEMFK